MDTFQLPPRKSLSEFLRQEPAPKKGERVFNSEPKTPRKGKCWTEEEHLAFLAGLKKLGKGNWRGIARYYVPTRTSTQIASHAQKYLQRITGTTKRKSKFSDIEQRVQGTPLADNYQPVWPLPDSLEASPRPANSAPAGTITAAGSEETEVQLPPPCKPTAVKATASEPDLLKLAESLISLSDPARTFSSSTSSAFTKAASPPAAASCQGA